MNKTAYTRVHRFMEEHGFDRFFLYRPENFAWLTGGGDSTVVTGEGVGYLEVSTGEIRLHASRIEVFRLQEEEKAEFEVITYPWYSSPSIQRPNDLESDLTSLRLVLSTEEQERFRALGRDAAGALGKAMRGAKPEWTERALAGAIAAAMYERGIQPIVLLVAGEERIFKYRHPLPKDQPLDRLAMAVLCGRRDGLVANLTRIRVWGRPDATSAYEKVLRVEARSLGTSIPGITLGDVLHAVAEGYQEIGCPEAFEEHHQGGIAGYRPREIIAAPGAETLLKPGMCVAWSPSLPGVKVEDTFLLTETGLENLTFDPDWPTVTVAGRLRPAVLAD